MKYFAIVKTFDRKQWTRFLTYLKLYYREDGTVCKIANWFDEQSIWKDAHYKEFTTEELFGELPFKLKHQTISNSISILGNVAEEYLGWMIWKDSPNLKKSCQLLGLARKSLSDQYLTIQKDILEETDKNITSIWDEHYRMRSLFHDYYFGISNSENHHADVFASLLSSFKKSTAIIAQLLFVEIKNRQKLLSESWNDYGDVFDMHYQTKTDLKGITDQLIFMNQSNDETAYEYLIDFLKSDKSKNVARHIQYSVGIYCINYLTKVIRKGEIHRGQELLDLYEYSLEKQILNLNETMSLVKFINIIGVASKLGKIEWARKIVDNWAHKVDAKNTRSVEKFGHSTIDFHEKKFEKVVEDLSNLKSSSFQYKLRFRWLLLIAQYELNKDYVNVVKTQVDNFRRFILSNESRTNRQTYLALKTSLKIINMLLNRKPQEQILEFYYSSKNTYERKWILEKIKNPV